MIRICGTGLFRTDVLESLSDYLPALSLVSDYQLHNLRSDNRESHFSSFDLRTLCPGILANDVTVRKLFHPKNDYLIVWRLLRISPLYRWAAFERTGRDSLEKHLS